MYISKLTVVKLPHCPADQLTRPGGGMNAGYDIRAAEDKIIYPPSMMREDESLNLIEWKRIGKLDDLSPNVQLGLEAVIDLNLPENKTGIRIDEDDIVYQVFYKPQLVSTGIVIQYDVLSWSLVTTRSSVGGKQLLSMPHGVGVIDFGYRGPEDEVFISLTSDDVRVIRKGDRIAQLIPMSQSHVELVHGNPNEDSFMNELSRGGFGSTGLN